jgi:PAS domain S-box-containing protein
MVDFLSRLFDTSDFPARWQCGRWTPGHGWLHILSDLGVWSAYVAIPCVLGYFVLRRRDIPFRTVFLLFGAFILACGTTHLLEVVMFWWPAYRLAGVVKLVTAVVSWGTVLALVPVTPRALAMRSAEELGREVTARKQAEHALEHANARLRQQVEALRASEERFRLLVDGTRDHAILMLDPSGHVASWNPGAERINGYRAQEIAGQHFSRFYPVEEIGTGQPDHNLRVAAAEGRFEAEGWRVRKDGSRFWASVVITALRDEGGQLRGFSKITRDETERRQAEANARRLLEEAAARRAAEEHAQLIERQREQLRVTLTSIGDGVVTTDAGGRVTLLNPVAERLTGWTNAEAAGQPLSAVFRIVHEKTGRPAENPVARVLATGRIVGLANHTSLIARDGTQRCIDDSAAPIRDVHGAVAGVVLVFRDVTERRMAERSARLLASIVASSDDAIIGKDVNGIITSWNDGAERIFGYTAAEAVGRPVAMLAPPDRADEAPGILQRIRRGERVDHFDTVRRGKDGRLVPVSLTVSPIRDEDGAIIGASKIARDISERRRAEAALREEKERLHATLTGIGDAVIVTDAAGRVILLNPVAQSLTGWGDEAAGRPLEQVFRIVNEQTRRPAESPALRVIGEGAVVGLANHTALVARDGTQRPIEDSAAPVRNEQGEVIGVVLVFRDASERRAAEGAAQRHGQVLKLVHQIGKIGHWEWNSLTDENKWSPEIEALYGLEPGTFGGTYDAWAKLLHPDDVPGQEEVVRRAFETGEYFTEFRVIWPDGSVHWLEARGNVFRDGHDKPVRFVGVNMDITERKRREEALRASEQRWRTMAEALPNLVWTDLPDGQCDWLSSQWGRYTGIPESELLGLRWLETVIHPDDRERTLACWQAACADRGDYDLEYRIRRHDGEYHWFKTRGVPVRDETGQIVYWFGTCTDIEDVKRLEGALREADRRKDEFLATLAHELRNSLAPLRTGLQVLRLAGEGAAREQAREMMERQLGQMIRLVDDLLDVSRITRNKLELRKARIPLASAVGSAVETARPLIDAKGHVLTVALPSQAVYLDADLTRLAQVFGNLLHNAAKYTDPGGRIDLSAECRAEEIMVTVRDSGIGIAAEALPRLFAIFSQIDRRLERSQGGLGIGLALVKGLVEMHGGTVEAHSAGLGRGSEFVLRLPLAESGPRDESPPAHPAGLEHHRRRVLVVDDSRDAAASLAMMLSLLGHDTRTAYDGLDALDLAATFRPEVVLLDIGMPKLNGYEVARRIRQEAWGKHMVLVACTGWGQDEDRRRSRESGFDLHLVKPVDPATLQKLLASPPN